MKFAVLRKAQLHKMKEVSEGDSVNSVSFCNKIGQRPRGNKGDRDTDESTKACGNCGQIHDLYNCFACRKTCDNQSIPAVPIPPRATTGHSLMLSVPGVGHLQFYRSPGAGHLRTPGRPSDI